MYNNIKNIKAIKQFTTKSYIECPWKVILLDNNIYTDNNKEKQKLINNNMKIKRLTHFLVYSIFTILHSNSVDIMTKYTLSWWIF